jgi:peptidoglycan-N-acetylglucosamine deacetylase
VIGRLRRICAISVDLDEISQYHAIHGLHPPEGAGASAVYDLGLARLGAWSLAEQIPLTFFAVGEDLEREPSRAALCGLVDVGHEVANHTLGHRYDLTRLSRAEMERQIVGGIEAIHAAVGVKPSGFRAPGYTMSDEVFDVLEGSGVAYDSSVFPCPPYYLAKAATMAAMRLGGRRSHSILDRPTVLMAPTEPYRVGRPYWRRGRGIRELPIQVTRFVRLPLIGTTLTMLGPDRVRWMMRAVVGLSFVNVELHGIDVLDASDGFAELAPHQPDARIPHARKLAALSAAVDVLRREGYSFVRLDEAASVI